MSDKTDLGGAEAWLAVELADPLDEDPEFQISESALPRDTPHLQQGISAPSS